METLVPDLTRPDATPVTASPLIIHFVRHAHAHGGPGIDSHGPTLTSQGHRQARCIGRRLAQEQYNAIYCSDLTRARHTADAIAMHHPDELLTVTRDLREVSGYHAAMHMSRLTMHSDHDILEEQEAMHRFINHLRSRHAHGEKVLIVSHGNLIRSLIPLLGGLDPSKAPLIEVFNTSLSIVDLWPSGRTIVRLLNCVAHLPERLVS